MQLLEGVSEVASCIHSALAKVQNAAQLVAPAPALNTCEVAVCKSVQAVGQYVSLQLVEQVLVLGAREAVV